MTDLGAPRVFRFHTRSLRPFGSECSKCGKLQFPFRENCTNCGTFDFERSALYPVNGEGWTRQKNGHGNRKEI
jgi:uncharacterized OB-fold protein